MPGSRITIIRPVFALCGFAFAAMLLAETCHAAPTIFSASDPTEPDETAIIAGDGLAKIRQVIITRLKDNSRSTDQSAGRQEVAPLQPTNESLKFTIPKSLGPGVYRFELVGEEGAVGAFMNAPTVYWAQGDRGPTASPGGWVRVMGRNIVRSSDAVLTLQPDGHATKPVDLHPAAGSLWDGTFFLPPDIPAGTYRLRLWNGQGDSRTISDAGSLSVAQGATGQRPSIDVTQFGAKGDGRNDDLVAVRAALAEAEKNGGGTVYFPRGRYFLSGALDIPPNTTLKGEARNLVSLNWPQFDKAPAALVSGFRDFVIRDLTLFAANYRSVISGGIDVDNRYRNDRPQGVRAGRHRNGRSRLQQDPAAVSLKMRAHFMF